MTDTALLSPNGQQETQGEGPTTRLFVATINGVVRLERAAPDAAWAVTGEALGGKHASSLLIEESSGKLFAGAHGEEGVWVSDDGAGASWRSVSNGIENRNIYSLAAAPRGNGRHALRRG